MSDVYVVVINGLSAQRSLSDIPKDTQRNALRAVNKMAQRARAEGSRQIRSQVAFTAGYLNQNERFTFKAARSLDDEAVVAARVRPTSLARFVTSGKPGNSKTGVRVKVSPDRAIRSRKMFLIRLRAGDELTETKFNLGLAIRLKEGETISNKIKMVQMSKGLYLLYGPSISQVFQTVAEDMAPEVAADVEAEFLRLMELNLR
jgi:hypothetical protein